LTTDAKFGVGFEAGPLSVIIAPEVFRAENQAFSLQPNGRGGNGVYADAYTPRTIDQPQRFGAGPYQRFDPGQSTIRLEAGPFSVGASTANEAWGPAAHPLVLGTNAGGFPHLFAGTAHPLDLWIVSLHGRVIWGRLDQSAYSPRDTGETRRFAAGVAGSMMIRGLPGLELGLTRFYHEAWPVGGPRAADFRRPFTIHNFAASRANLAGRDAANQLASIFGRWTFPRAGLEVYGEFVRDDYNADVYDLVAEPDHDSGYIIGLERTWKRADNRLFVLRADVLNSRTANLGRVRAETPLYEHTSIVQGHTERGQVLGAFGGKGGGAAELFGDLYQSDGRWTIGWSRHMVDETDPSQADVWHGVTIQRLWFTAHADISATLTQAVELNRRPGQDVGNLNVQLSMLVHW
jgi:hypothetical protein